MEGMSWVNGFELAGNVMNFQRHQILNIERVNFALEDGTIGHLVDPLRAALRPKIWGLWSRQRMKTAPECTGVFQVQTTNTRI
jgi:hypothetical protein